MPLHRTRSMASGADFQFIMTTIFGQKADSPLFKAFERSCISDVGDIVSLSDRAIDRLKYRDDTVSPSSVEELGLGLQQLIRVFQAFVHTKIIKGNLIHDDWQNKTLKDEFNEFRIVGFTTYISVAQTLASTVAISGGHTGSSASFTPRPRDIVLEFKKGIKRDPASFTVLTDNKQWDSVHRTLKS